MYCRLFRLCGRLGCHQRPDRSFFLRGRQFPLCARCTGMFAGYAAGFLTVCFCLPPWPLGAVCLLPMLFVLFAQNALGRESTNIRRAVTGFAAGWGVLALCAQAAALLTACLSGQ